MMKLFSYTAFTVGVVVSLAEVNGSSPHFCTNWNTNITSVCKTISFFHGIFSSVLNPDKKLRHCDFLRRTPHCCEQFCIPAVYSGTCEEVTGVCRCKGKGKPEMCSIFFEPRLEGTRKDSVFEICKKKCATGGKSDCTTPSYMTDSFNYMCICYCP